MSTLSTTELTKVRDALARALSSDDLNQLGRATGQAKRLRTVTPHRLFLAVVSALASAHVESLADLLRAFNYQNGVKVAYAAAASSQDLPSAACRCLPAHLSKMVSKTEESDSCEPQ